MSEVGRFLTNYAIKNGFIAVLTFDMLLKKPLSNPHSFVHFLKPCRDIRVKYNGISYLFHRQYLIGKTLKSDDFVRVKEQMEKKKGTIDIKFLP